MIRGSIQQRENAAMPKYVKPGRVVRLDGKSYRPRRVVRLPAPPDPQFSGRPIFYIPRGVAVVNNKTYDRQQIAKYAASVREMRAWKDPQAAFQHRRLCALCIAFEEKYGERP